MADDVERAKYEASIKSLGPPWLQRIGGARFMGQLGAAADRIRDRVIAAVSLRFPGLGDESALPAIGRERRIRRGPNEPAASYQRRLRRWLDDHRGRGGPYALLEQLYEYFLDSLNVRMDVVYHSGTRRWIDEAGVITRDSITWSTPPDGTDHWAQFWVVFYLPAPTFPMPLLTESGEPLLTESGEPIVADVGIETSPGEMSDELAEVFRAVPREWSAAHIERSYVVLLWGVGELWDYPQPVGTWDEWADPDRTIDEDMPIVLVVE